MSKNIGLTKIEKNGVDKINIVIENVIKMLTERNILLKKDLDANIKKYLGMKTSNMIYIFEKEKIAIKITPQKITAINNSFGIKEFLGSYNDYHKLIIVDEITIKATNYILDNFNSENKVEIFLIKNLLENIIENNLVPQHILLSDKDAQKVLNEYQYSNKQLSIIHSSESISKYYNAKPGDIFRIIRPSEKTGNSVAYRIVKKHKNQKK